LTATHKVFVLSATVQYARLSHSIKKMPTFICWCASVFPSQIVNSVNLQQDGTAAYYHWDMMQFFNETIP